MPRHGKSDSKSGFTLLEMLIVIVIIIVLMGVVFKLSKGALLNAEKAKEIATVSKLKALAEEFHAEYGIYPPVPEYDGVQPFQYRGPHPLNAADLEYWHKHKNNSGAYDRDVYQTYFTFGFLSFFLDRTSYAYETFKITGKRDRKAGTPVYNWNKYNEEIPDNLDDFGPSTRDASFIKRVKPILSPILSASVNEIDEDNHSMGFTVAVVDTHLSWDNYVYISKPPYTSYIIFWKGPDGRYDTSAPEDRTKPLNKDNIYAELGDK